MKGKGITKKLSQPELVANAEMKENATMEGKGIFGKKFDKFLKRLGKKAGFNVKKTVYQVGDMIKPYAKKAIKTGLNTLATVAEPILPEGVAPVLVEGISKKADAFLDKPSDFGVGSGLYATGGGHYDADGTYHPNKFLTHRHNFNKHRDLKIGSGLYSQTPRVKGKGRKMPPNFVGGELRRNIPKNELASVGLGGTLLSNYEQHPAQVSQPWSQRFQWGSTLPPYYQQFSNGLQ
jgi:hypothetical protein